MRAAAGSTVRLTGRHAQQRQSEPPRYDLWGEGTADEMCLGALQVTTR